jgi:glutamate racemase
VLGCTHYPFLAPLIRELTGNRIALDDPAAAVARRVVELLAGQHPTEPVAYQFITTASDATSMVNRLPALIGQSFPVAVRPLD